MNEGSVENSIFISPPLKFETDWSGGDELTLNLSDTLASNLTYVITIGSGATDMQKNRMANSYQFAFSTGDKLNSGEIYGRVFDISEKDLFYIYAYHKENPDSLNPTIVKADFLSQPGPDGRFWLKYLPLGEYRIFVVEDKNKNLLLDLTLERVGLPVRDVVVDTSLTPSGPLNFRVTKIDTVPPDVTSARALNNRSVLLRASEVVQLMRKETISIQDTLDNETLGILDLTLNKDGANQVILYTSPQDSGKGYRIFVSGLEDSSGNKQTDLQTVDFVGSYIIDTTRFALSKLAPPDSLKGVKLSSKISLLFTLPLDTAELSMGFKCWDNDSAQVKGLWTWRNLSEGFFSPLAGFIPGKQYYFSISTKYLKSIWGDTLADSTYKRVFFTLSEDEFGILSGIYLSKTIVEHTIYIQLIPVGRNLSTDVTTVNEEMGFQFRWVLEGNYQLSGFIDLDNNGIYSPGNLFPFEFSEPYVLTDDTFHVRKRWELSDIHFNIPGLE